MLFTQDVCIAFVGVWAGLATPGDQIQLKSSHVWSICGFFISITCANVPCLGLFVGRSVKVGQGGSGHREGDHYICYAHAILV